ncbi:MAG: iron-sulfur-binding protein [Anaerolineaceae bacterium]|nr:MAG: iron-sulfur-binding protein [Anaerolineaceae bacterium]
MLTFTEKIVFAVLMLISAALTYRGVRRIVRQIASGQGKIDWSLAPKRIGELISKYIFFTPVFRFRLWVSVLHAFIGWGFFVYVIVNLNELIFAYANVNVLHQTGLPGDLFRFLAEFLSFALMLSMIGLSIRRYIFNPATLRTRDTTLLDPRARRGITIDSAIVTATFFTHTLARVLAESFYLARHGVSDAWQPLTSAIARLWANMPQTQLLFDERLMFWISLGLVFAFLPYFPYSKHMHLFVAPLNFALKPERKSMGQLSYIDLDDQSIEQFGAAKMSDLGWEQIMDAYACIQCFRCQEVCPAYNTGKILSPAALEINKRYHLKTGDTDAPMLNLISEEAVWACTSCGACVDICPVGNEPMRDILDIRRNLAMMESQFPKELENAFKGIERNANPWNVPQADRLKWAEGLDVPTIEQNPKPDVLWWVGCAPATDPRAQKTAQAFAKILNAARVNFAVLGKHESCTGDPARRAGREDIFFAMASQNVEVLNEVKPKRIVATCPHCLHVLKNEYPAFGGEYEVVHHTQLINELVGAGKISMEVDEDQFSVTFHDPCYLGRHNNIFDAPRDALTSAGASTIEMPRHAEQAFCCGAGGAQIWKEEEEGTMRVNTERFTEAKATGALTLAVGCPFCLLMMTDASKADGGEIQVKDVAEIVAERLK